MVKEIEVGQLGLQHLDDGMFHWFSERIAGVVKMLHNRHLSLKAMPVKEIS